jgi:hypothetical protein
MRSRLSVLIAFVVVLTTIVTSGSAAGEEKPKRGPAAALSRCRSLALALEASEPASALAIYEQAFCLTRLGNWAGAVNAATRWLEHPEAKPDRKKLVRDQILPHARKTARVVFDPADAEVELDGRPVKTASGVLYVPPGTHTFLAHAGDAQLDRQLEMFAGETRVLEIPPPSPPVLAPAPAPVPAPVPASSPAPTQPTVLAHESPTVGQDASRGSALPVVLALGGAALAAGAGTWLLFSSVSDHDDADQTRRQANHDGMSCYGRNNATCIAADDLETSRDRKRTAAVGCFAGAGAIVATTLLVHLFSPHAEGAPRLATPIATATATPTRGGALVGGSVRF